jgi:hypothetical protein
MPSAASSIFMASSMFAGTMVVLMAGVTPPPQPIDQVFDIDLIKRV